MKIRTYSTAWGTHENLYWMARKCIETSEKRLRAEGHSVEHELFTRCENPEGRDRSNGLADNFRECMVKCVDNDEHLFLLQPDTMFGSESFYNICMYGYDQDAYVMLPHLRFSIEPFLRGNPQLPMSNQELLDYCWQMPHPTTEMADIRREKNNTHDRLALFPSGEFTVLNHFYPTIYFFKPKADDLKIWSRDYRARKHAGWIFYDTDFLSYVCSTGRYRILGSSDFAFAAELEETVRHYPQPIVTTRALPTKIACRGYSDRLVATSYVIRKNLDDMRKGIT